MGEEERQDGAGGLPEPPPHDSTPPGLDRPSRRRRRKVSWPEEPGFFFGLLVAVSFLAAVRLLASLGDNTFWRVGVYLGAVLLVWKLPYLWASLWKALVLVAVVAVGVVLWRDRALIDEDRMTVKHVVNEALELSTGLGPAHEMVEMVADNVEPQEPGQEGDGKPGRKVVAEPKIERYDPIFEAFDAWDEAVNDKALQLIRECRNQDRLCKATKIARFVQDEIDYRDDPNTENRADYVKHAARTLAVGAGDCEDQAVLLLSMLISVDIKAFLVDLPGHMAVIACFEESLLDMVNERFRKHGWPSIGYLRWDLPKETDDFEPYVSTLCEVRLPAWDGDKEKHEMLYCYSVEATSPKSWLRAQHKWNELQAVVDPINKRLFRKVSLSYSAACEHRPR